MSDKRVRFTILAILVLLTLSLLRTAYIHNLWREFIITEIQLLASTATLLYLLRERKS